jgi:hypothetical protein
VVEKSPVRPDLPNTELATRRPAISERDVRGSGQWLGLWLKRRHYWPYNPIETRAEPSD